MGVRILIVRSWGSRDLTIPMVSVKVLMDKEHRDERQRDRLIDRHTQLNTKYDLGMISYVPLGKSSF